MIKTITNLIIKYKSFITYVICGGLAALISMITYFVSRKLFPDANSVPSLLQFLYLNSVTLLPNIIAWIFAATFAYITNKFFVFQNKTKGLKDNLRQILIFYAARLTTLAIDMLIMFLFIDMMNIQSSLYEFCIKIFSNIIILVLNYVFSKLLVFRKT